MEARALYDFRARDEQELSIRAGESVLVVEVSSADWYIAEKQRMKGIVPANYLEIGAKWFDPKGDRAQAEKKLTSPGTFEGNFVVRPSTVVGGKFSISVRVGHLVQHYGLLRNELGQYVIWDRAFGTVDALVQFYKENSINQVDSDVRLTEQTGARTSSYGAPPQAATQFAGAHQAGGYQVGAYPTGAPQAGAYPTGAPQAGAYPTGAPQAGAYPTGAPQAGAYRGAARYVVAQYDYDPPRDMHPNQYLQLRPGDRIEVLEENQDGWWMGVLNGRRGLFPSTLVTNVA